MLKNENIEMLKNEKFAKKGKSLTFFVLDD